MEPGHIAVRAVFTFLFLLAIVRSSGKRTVHQGSMFDFIFALILGDLIDDAIWADVPAANFVVAIGALTLLKITSQILEARSPLVARITEGTPTVVIQKGRPVESGLVRLQLPMSELEAMTRLQGLDRTRWGEIRAAWVEVSGELSIQREARHQEAQRGDVERAR